MKRYIIIIMLIVAKTSCFGQDVKPINFKLSIYPSSGGEIGYIVEFENTSLKVISRELVIEKGNIVLGDIKSNKEIELSNCEISKIRKYFHELENLKTKYKDVDLALDVWVFDFLINGERSVKINSYILEDTTNFKRTKKLIKYLQKISPVEMKLRDFS